MPTRSYLGSVSRLSLSAISILSFVAQGAAAPCLPDTTVAVGVPQTFATHKQLASLGFLWGVSDGNFGAIPTSGGNYTFYGTGGSASLSPPEGAYTFCGTLDNVLGANTTTKLFGPGSGPAGWIFDRDYAGGGMVVPFDEKKATQVGCCRSMANTSGRIRETRAVCASSVRRRRRCPASIPASGSPYRLTMAAPSMLSDRRCSRRSHCRPSSAAAPIWR